MLISLIYCCTFSAHNSYFYCIPVIRILTLWFTDIFTDSLCFPYYCRIGPASRICSFRMSNILVPSLQRDIFFYRYFLPLICLSALSPLSSLFISLPSPFPFFNSSPRHLILQPSWSCQQSRTSPTRCCIPRKHSRYKNVLMLLMLFFCVSIANKCCHYSVYYQLSICYYPQSLIIPTSQSMPSVWLLILGYRWSLRLSVLPTSHRRVRTVVRSLLPLSDLLHFASGL